MKVKDPSGQTWRVSRRWVPWRRRLRGMWGWLDLLPSGGGNDPISSVLFVIMLVICLPFIVISLVAGFELGLLVLLVPVLSVFRIPFGKHWFVEVRRGRAPWWEGDAGTWQTSRAKIDEIAKALLEGVTPLQTLYLTKEQKQAAQHAAPEQ